MMQFGAGIIVISLKLTKLSTRFLPGVLTQGHRSLPHNYRGHSKAPRLIQFVAMATYGSYIPGERNIVLKNETTIIHSAGEEAKTGF